MVAHAQPKKKGHEIFELHRSTPYPAKKDQSCYLGDQGGGGGEHHRVTVSSALLPRQQ